MNSINFSTINETKKERRRGGEGKKKEKVTPIPSRMPFGTSILLISFLPL